MSKTNTAGSVSSLTSATVIAGDFLAMSSARDINPHVSDGNGLPVNGEASNSRRDTSVVPQGPPSSQTMELLNGDVSIHELGNVARTLQGYLT